MKQTKMMRCALAVLMMALLPLSCNDMETPSIAPDASSSTAPVYYFSIPASIGNDADTKAVTIGESTITSAFANTDKVYVFIERSGNPSTIAVAHNGTDASTYLTPSNINGATCTLEGALKFYYNDNDNFAAFEPAADDVVYLYYNMNEPVEDVASYIVYAGLKYYEQNGSKDEDVYEDFMGQQYLVSTGASACGFAEAKMKVTEVTDNGTDGYTLTMVQYGDNTKSNVHFENMGSMLRQRLSFTDKNSQPIAIPTIERLAISFEGDGGAYTVENYYPFEPDEDYYSTSFKINLDNPFISAEGDVYLALMFYDDNKNLPLVLEAVDTDGNVYSVSKTAPTGGFQNGKYYYGSATLAWQKCIKPTVTGTSATPSYGKYTIPEDPVNLTISGNSEGYYFRLEHGGTVTLDNLNATINNIFIYQLVNPAEDVSLVLTGTNTISANAMWAILIEGNSKLKLSCTGASATLTVTATLNWDCGIQCNNYSSNNNEYTTTTELDVTALLAADGYSVTRSARTDNDDGSYTWTYTVRKLGKFSVSGTKQVYFSPGDLQYQASTTTWRFAEHQYDFVGDNSDGNVYVGAVKCSNQLIANDYTGWIDLFGWGTSGYNDKYPYMTSTSSLDYANGANDISGTEYDWGVHNSIGTYAAGTWRTPTHDEWVYLLNTDGSSGRSDAYRFALGMVHSVQGLIIFPDGFAPVAAGVTISNPNVVGVGPTTYSDADWTKMEAAGCVFLPMAGLRGGTSVSYLSFVNTSGFYWSSTYANVSGDNAYAYALYFEKNGSVNPSYNGHGYYHGEAVRLVRDVPVAP